jgi:hypothetical protein
VAVPLWRFILIYVFYIIICIFFLFISFNILKRDKKSRLNQFLALFHFSIVLSLISNFIYASYSLPSQEPIATFLHILSAYFITIASGFLLLFIILLYKPENGFSKTAYQVLFLSFYFVLGLFFFLIPYGIKLIPIR